MSVEVDTKCTRELQEEVYTLRLFPCEITEKSTPTLQMASELYAVRALQIIWFASQTRA
jgi:hypothetical protein